MSGFDMKILGVICPHCGTNCPVPVGMSNYEWKTRESYSSKRDWYCVRCGEKFSVKVKRHIYEVSIAREGTQDE